jgi:hypothetical protein
MQLVSISFINGYNVSSQSTAGHLLHIEHYLCKNKVWHQKNDSEGKKKEFLYSSHSQKTMRTFNMSTALPTVTNINVMVFCLINIFWSFQVSKSLSWISVLFLSYSLFIPLFQIQVSLLPKLWNNTQCEKGINDKRISQQKKLVRLYVYTEASQKITVFLDVVPYSLIEIYWHYRSAWWWWQ